MSCPDCGTSNSYRCRHVGGTPVIGHGETYYVPTAAAAVIHDFMAPRLLGSDVRAIESHWRFLYERMTAFGGTGAELRALSAVDLALWDIAGQLAEQPVWRLLGGPVRDAVSVYNSCGGPFYGVPIEKRRPLPVGRDMEIRDSRSTGRQLGQYECTGRSGGRTCRTGLQGHEAVVIRCRVSSSGGSPSIMGRYPRRRRAVRKDSGTSGRQDRSHAGWTRILFARRRPSDCGGNAARSTDVDGRYSASGFRSRDGCVSAQIRVPIAVSEMLIMADHYRQVLEVRLPTM